MTEEVVRALERVRNSDAAGIAHQEIYGYDVRVDLAILGRAFMELNHEPRD